ncbi:siderophore-iron reductase FhuF [Mesorhizobium sp. NPDC059054]|uniref:siderophore-iron reductase FhuF n=1 Tax=Mesorhizobium sp. NPDC059054 TaxID=3346711 RepID=UPI0036D1E161
MIPALASLLPAKLAGIVDPLVLADDPSPAISGRELFDQRRIKQCLTAFGRNYKEPDAQAVATQWSKWHFSIVLTPVLALNIVADRQLPIALDEIGVLLSPDSRTQGLRLPDSGSTVHFDNAHQRFARIVEGHLAPVVSALSQASTLPSKVLWSNAGNVVENVVAECASWLGDEHRGVRDARAFLASRTWPDGRKNELFEPIRYSGTGTRRRRICCLRYRMDSLPLCKSCPLDRIPQRAVNRSSNQAPPEVLS